MSQNAEVHICNLALGHVGDESVIQSLTEESKAARRCKLVYADARDHLLEAHDWSFARRHVLLALSGDPAPGLWTFAYARPADAQAIRRIYDKSADLTLTQEPEPFEIGFGNEAERLIFTDVKQAQCRYTARITDATRYSQGFIHALSLKIAVAIAMPMTGSRQILSDVSARYTAAFKEATTMDANQSERVYDNWTASHIAARA